MITALQALADKHPVYGFRKLFACLKRDGKSWNHKKVYRVYKIATSITAKRVVRILEQLIDWRGKPVVIRVDNGPEFTSADFSSWRKKENITIQYIQPGKPMQNGYIERFNGSYRREILDAYLFFNLEEVRQLTESWMEEYNTQRPHEALGNLTPSQWPVKNRSGNMENLHQHPKPNQQVYHIPTS